MAYLVFNLTKPYQNNTKLNRIPDIRLYYLISEAYWAEN